MKNENDLRVIKTRRNIMESFVKLLEEKPLENITVTEICKMAGCSRNTFYQHFPYKEQLDEAIVNSYIDRMRNAFKFITIKPGESYEDYSIRYLTQIGKVVLSERERLRPILVGNRKDSFFQKLTAEMYKMIIAVSDYIRPGCANERKARLMTWYSASAFVGYLTGCYLESDLSNQDINFDEDLKLLCELHTPFFVKSMEYLQLKKY